MATQSIITGDLQIRDLNGVLIAVNGIVDAAPLTSGTAGTSGTSGTSGTAGTSGFSGTSAMIVYTYTATAGQTTFSVPSGYVNSMLAVFVNGVKLTVDDYVANNGTTVVLNNPVQAGDKVEIDNFVSSYISTSGT